jgi:hypothetical protein
MLHRLSVEQRGPHSLRAISGVLGLTHRGVNVMRSRTKLGGERLIPTLVDLGIKPSKDQFYELLRRRESRDRNPCLGEAR